MALTRDFKERISARVARDPAFAEALFNEAINQLTSGESEVARLLLRDLVNASIGFERLAAKINTPSKSLHRMLSERGNPSMDNFAEIVSALRGFIAEDSSSIDIRRPRRAANG